MYNYAAWLQNYVQLCSFDWNYRVLWQLWQLQPTMANYGQIQGLLMLEVALVVIPLDTDRNLSTVRILVIDAGNVKSNKIKMGQKLSLFGATSSWGLSLANRNQDKNILRNHVGQVDPMTARKVCVPITTARSHAPRTSDLGPDVSYEYFRQRGSCCARAFQPEASRTRPAEANSPRVCHVRLRPASGSTTSPAGHEYASLWLRIRATIHPLSFRSDPLVSSTCEDDADLRTIKQVENYAKMSASGILDPGEDYRDVNPPLELGHLSEKCV
ncbi:hypothetical protein B0H11DRAFT_1914305 [Mycena galericulata]|nr:hypothetical protein B0H11DRAFT_1914305 [Mycena galericulata]